MTSSQPTILVAELCESEATDTPLTPIPHDSQTTSALDRLFSPEPPGSMNKERDFSKMLQEERSPMVVKMRNNSDEQNFPKRMLSVQMD